MRCIIHLDMDCFYAQVDALRLRVDPERPLGVRQASLLVTCNYAARARGLRKCMPVDEAMRACPDLLLVPGEDLRPYRRASEKVHEALRAFGLPVERAGLDENYVDATDALDVPVDDASILECGCPRGAHALVAKGARLADDMRSAVRRQVGLTCCAGVAHTKNLAKLVGAQRKPDTQTAIFPCESVAFLSSLPSVRSLPGVGAKTGRALKSLGVDAVAELQACPVSLLERSLGKETAARLKRLSLAVDDDAVSASSTSHPQHISVEESFRSASLLREVDAKFKSLASRLIACAQEDGRVPGGVRITVRKYDAQRNLSHRHTRQCRLSPSAYRKGAPEIARVALDLFARSIDTSRPFRITLLGLAFVKMANNAAAAARFVDRLADLSVHSVTDLRNDTPIVVERPSCALESDPIVEGDDECDARSHKKRKSSEHNDDDDDS